MTSKMTDPMPNLVVRHGCLDDRQAVLDIDKSVYGGLDYLSARYNMYCDDPRRINYILEANGQAVAYFVATVVDDGESVIFQAARTHPEHRQRGYYSHLKKAAAKELKTMYPNMKEALAFVVSSTPYDPWLVNIDGARKLLYSKPFRVFYLSQPDDRLKVKVALEKQQHLVKAVQKVPFEKIEEFLKKDDFMMHLTEDTVLIDLVPYKLGIPSNFSLPNRFPEFFLVSYDEGGRIDGVSFHDFYLDEDRDMERHDLIIYSESSYMKHYAFFFNSVLESRKCSNVICLSLYPLSLDNTGVDITLKETLGVAQKNYTPPFSKEDCPYFSLVSDSGYFNAVSKK